MNPIHNWIKDKPEKITCEISAYDFESLPLPALNFQSCGDAVRKKLIEAGIPIDKDNNILSGTLRRFNCPEDFSRTIYEWSAEN